MPLPFAPRYVELEEKGHLMIVRFNRVKQLNSMPPAMHCELSKIWKYFDNNDDLWVAIVTGNGKAFSAGFDLKSAAGIAAKEDTQIDRESGVRLDGDRMDGVSVSGGTGFAGLTEREGVKPVIAAVNGLAHGGGFETALACDVIIMSENAEVCLPEPKRGLYAAAGGVVRLPRIIGYHNALSMILTGRPVKAAEAKELGICSMVVPGGNDEVLKAAEEIAEQILACSPDAIQASLQVAKRTMAEEPNMCDAILLGNSLPTVQRLYSSTNVVEGPMAFAQKRRPDWRAPKPLSEFPRAKL